MATVSLKGEQQDLFSGVLYKVGGKVKTWNKRFFVLKSDYILYYFKDTSKGALGTISLKDAKFQVRKGVASDITWPRQTKLDCTMAVVTSHRTYCMYSLYSHEIEEWICKLTKAREKASAQSISQNKLLSGGRSASSSQLEQTVQGKPASNKSRPMSSSAVTYEAMYDAPASVNHDVDAVYEPQMPEMEAVYALASSVETEELYEDVLPAQDPIIPDETTVTPLANEMYEEMIPQANDSPPLYDDFATDIVQPLYEDIPVQHASDKTQDNPPLPARVEVKPPLPPRADDTPPLLSRQVSPPLPPKVDSSTSPHFSATDIAQPLYEDIPLQRASDILEEQTRDSPPLPPRADDTPPLPARVEDTPPLPPRADDTPPLLLRQMSPPLPPKVDSSTSPPPHKCADSPPTYETPPTFLEAPCDIYDTPPIPLLEAPPTSSILEATPTLDDGPPTFIEATPIPDHPPDNDNKERKPSPVPRRKSFSPQQLQEEQARPIAKPRIHHALSPEPDVETGEGMSLFRLQKQRIEESGQENVEKRTESIRLMEEVTTDPKLSLAKKAVFAETMREVEHERLLASEERFRWERERKKLEEERRKFEEEKKRLEERFQLQT